MARKIKKPSKSTLLRSISGLKRHLDNFPNDTQSQTHLAKKEAKLASL